MSTDSASNDNKVWIVNATTQGGLICSSWFDSDAKLQL